MELVETVNVLNIDKDASTISAQQLIVNENKSISDEEYIISDADEELLILIQFKQQIQLKSTKIYSIKNTIQKINNNETDIDVSQAKDVCIYKLSALNVNFDDLGSI
eukprot:422958_1